MAGIGDFLGLLGKVGDRLIMSKKEKLRYDIRETKKQMDEISNRRPISPDDNKRYIKLSARLSELQKRSEEG